MTSNEIKIGETTQATLSGHRVGVSNIWERDLPDADGNVAPRMSATLSITEVATGKETPDFQVSAGSVVTLGADRYCVVRVEAAPDEPGDIYLRKLPP